MIHSPGRGWHRLPENSYATILTSAPALKLRTPVIARCPVNLECQVSQGPTLGSQGLPIGQIVAV
ncbi:MAG: hypothetical protein HY783_05455 [Chloroflexi bacterium]|nr:hypothetical protein [Chloroflexota bacterium]